MLVGKNKFLNHAEMQLKKCNFLKRSGVGFYISCFVKLDSMLNSESTCFPSYCLVQIPVDVIKLFTCCLLPHPFFETFLKRISPLESVSVNILK